MLEVRFDEFTWQHPARRRLGFRWAGEGDARHLALLPGAVLEPYQPHPGTFRDLADLAPDPAAICKFVNRYGVLRTEAPSAFLVSWVDAIRAMHDLVALADALNAADWNKVRQLLDTADDPDDVLADAAGQRLGGVLKRTALDQGLDVEGTLNPVTKHAQLRFKHADLHGFMFFQLALSVVGDRRYRRCEYCCKWFQVAPSVGRADKASCSASCRSQLYRRRRRRAVQLHGEGLRLKQIAKKIASDVATVRKWIGKAKGG
jgi:hypothetical protein